MNRNMVNVLAGGFLVVLGLAAVALEAHGSGHHEPIPLGIKRIGAWAVVFSGVLIMAIYLIKYRLEPTESRQEPGSGGEFVRRAIAQAETLRDGSFEEPAHKPLSPDD